MRAQHACAACAAAGSKPHRRLPRLRHEACDVVLNLKRHERAVKRPVIRVVLLRDMAREPTLQQHAPWPMARSPCLDLLDELSLVGVGQLLQEALLEDIRKD